MSTRKKAFGVVKVLGVAALAASLMSGPAFAQQSKDTLRVGFYQPIQNVNPNFFPSPEAITVGNAVFDSIVIFDAESRTVQPLLAKSWKRVDDKTLEFKLREDVKFHDGSDFDADDVVFTFAALADPNLNFPLKGGRYGWIANVTKVDKYTVRVQSKRVTASDLNRLAGPIVMYPAGIYDAAGMMNEFGKAPIGTGPYKAIQVDTAKGIVLVKNEAYNLGSKGTPAGKIGRIEIRTVPDQQTQVARLLTGEQDLIFDVENDLAKSLASRPGLLVNVQTTVAFNYIFFDVVDKSGIGVFKNKKVRRALLHAIDREALKLALVPAQVHGDPLQQAMCNPWHIACDSSVAPPVHDLALAKKLLAEAGLADGFDLEISTWGQSRIVAEAVAGQLRQIGVKARIDNLTLGAFRRKSAENKMQMGVTLWDNGVGQPDVDLTLGFLFLPGSRDYTGDKRLVDAIFAGGASLDLKKRTAIFRDAFDLVTNESYMMPLTPLPAVVVHKDYVKLIGGHKNPHGIEFNRIEWN